MTGVIWLEWLEKLNKQFVAQNRKILLLVDNFSGHKVNPGGYSNIKVHFFPANMTSVVQPINMGIIHSFKCKYRQQVVREKLHAIKHCDSMPTIDILKAIHKAKIAWDSVGLTTIINCFRKADFHRVAILIACSFMHVPTNVTDGFDLQSANQLFR